MRFAITGPGQCGTMFLAQALGRSREFIVRHEHTDDSYGWFRVDGTYDRVGHLRLARERFLAHDNYGEVNNTLRHIVAELPVDKRGVVIRNPLEVALSAINKRPMGWMGMDGFSRRAAHLRSQFEAAHKWAEADYPVWRFERYTSDADYMAQILDWLGITDVDPLKVSYGTRVNAVGRKFCDRIARLVPKHRVVLRDNLKWFADIYYPGTWEA